jgi:hypothetical protein
VLGGAEKLRHGRWRLLCLGSAEAKVIEGLPDRHLVGDEGDEAHALAAASAQEFARRERRDLGGLTASLATAEDTILSKLEWAREGGSSERQLEDALGVLRVGADRIDRAYVERWAQALGALDLWRLLLTRL